MLTVIRKGSESGMAKFTPRCHRWYQYGSTSTLHRSPYWKQYVVIPCEKNKWKRG